MSHVDDIVDDATMSALQLKEAFLRLMAQDGRLESLSCEEVNELYLSVPQCDRIILPRRPDVLAYHSDRRNASSMSSERLHLCSCLDVRNKIGWSAKLREG